MAQKLGFVGCGNMGMAILRGALRAGVLPAEEILVAELNAERRAEAEGLGCRTSMDPNDAAGCEQFVLGVKPQSFRELAEAIGPLSQPAVVISVMAGLTSQRIRAGLGERARVVRVMPNTPCQIGQGICAVALGDGARPGDDELTRRVLAAIGEVVTIDESLFYAVTAVSGSGPAYAFLLAEAMEEAAVALGIDAENARALVSHTIRGAGGLLVQSDATPAELREAVTSKGGTTAAALDVMYKSELPAAVVKAVTAARDRGVELDR